MTWKLNHPKTNSNPCLCWITFFFLTKKYDLVGFTILTEPNQEMNHGKKENKIAGEKAG